MKRTQTLLTTLVCSASAFMVQAATAADEEAGPIEEVVVTGYSTQSKKDLTGAVASVDIGAIADKPAGNVVQNLQGKIPGVQITTSGNPSSAATIRIRGQGLGPLGFNDPLFVIDGVPSLSGLERLNSNDIESVQVLRDAASASIYGARAANGVLIITTKKGISDGLEFNFKANRTYEDFSFGVNPLNTEQRARALFQAAINDGTDPNDVSPLYYYDWNNDFGSPQLNCISFGVYTNDGSDFRCSGSENKFNFIDSDRTMQAADTSWFDEITRTAVIDDVNLSFSSGNEQSRFYGSAGYYNAEGVIDGSNFKRLTLRLNSDHEMADGKVRFGENMTATWQEEALVNSIVDSGNNPLLALSIEQQSIVPIHTVDGVGWGGPTGGITDRDNPVRKIELNKDNFFRTNKFLGNIFAEYEPIEDLTLRTLLGVDYTQIVSRIFNQESQAGSIGFGDDVRNSEFWEKGVVWSNTVQYKWYMNDQNTFTFLLGHESIDYTSENFFGQITDFAIQDYNFAYLGVGTGSPLVGGTGDEWRMKGFFAKIDYDYAGKYLLSALMRRDGSSRFGEGSQWGNFPAASAGWRISDEDWFDFEFINELKLRVSWGETGNQEFPSTGAVTYFLPKYATRSIFDDTRDEGTAYDISGANGGALPSGYVQEQLGNPQLQWETSEQTNVGLDFTVWEDKVYGSIDWYTKETSDIITQTTPLAVAGEGAQRYVNGGTIENTGWELVLGYDSYVEMGDSGFDLDIAFNLSKSENEVKELPSDVVNSFPGNGQDITILGESINAQFGLIADGIFQSQAEVDAHASQIGAAPGRIRYQDVNGDGTVDANDQIFFTTTDNDYTYGLNINAVWGNWDFTMFWQGVAGGDVRNDWRFFTDFVSLNAGSNYGDRVFDAWTPENQSDIPALSRVDPNQEARNSSYYYEKADYLKLRTLTIGYTLPESFLNALRAETARIYLQGSNLWTWTPEDTVVDDPEVPSVRFPVPKRFTVGFDITF